MCIEKDRLYPAGNSTYSFPADLASFVAAKWDNLVSEPDYVIPALPSKKILVKLLEVCYLASMESFEGRMLKFTVCYTKGAEKSIKNRSGDELEAWQFENFRELNMDELKILAGITEDGSVAIWVCCGRTKTNSMQIKALINVGLSWQMARASYSYNCDPSPMTLTIRVYGPGNLEVYQGENIVASLSSGRIFEQATLSILDYFGIHSFITNGINTFKAMVKKPKHESKKKRLEFEWLSFINVFLQIVNVIISKNHGGSLLVVDDTNNDSFSKVKIKYPFIDNENLLRTRFIDFLNIRNELTDLFWSNEHSTDSKPDKAVMMEKKNEYESRVNSLISSIRFIGNLSSTDGAIIITTSMKVIGFSSEILTENYSESDVYEVIEGIKQKLDVEKFGMRHRSAMQFCAANENVFSFIVSQDGHASLCWNEDHQVLFKRGINIKNTNMILA